MPSDTLPAINIGTRLDAGMTSTKMPAPPVRPLPDAPFVSLTEAKSWLAFGTALPKKELMHHVAIGSFGPEADAERIGQQALDKILDAVVGQRLKMQAEPSDTGEYRPGVPRDITVEEARVYREFYEPDECLQYLGERNSDGSPTLDAILNDTKDTRRKFYKVAVSREDLVSLESPAVANDPPQRMATTIPKKRPGPPRDKQVVAAIEDVAAAVHKAGYSLPLRWGEYQSIKDQIRSKLTVNEIERTDRSLRNYADEIRAALPKRDS